MTMIISLPEKHKPLSSKIIRNVFFGGLRFLFIAPIPLFLTPLILTRIGMKGYGTWAVFMAISNMTSLADLGLVGTVSKYVAEYHARRDFPALDRLLNTGLALFGLLSIVLTSLLWIGSSFIVPVVFRDSPVAVPELVVLFRYFLIVIVANVLTLLFSSVSSGLQRLDLTNMMSAFNIVFGAVLGGFLIFRGWGLRGLLCGQICSTIVTALIYLVIVRRLLPQILLNPLHIDVTEARKLFSFSLQLYLTQAAMAVHNQIEKIFLSLFIGVGAAGVYDIASDLALKIRSAIGLVLSPVLPAASELNALRDERRLRELYYRVHKYLAFIGLPIVCYVAAISTRFVDLWIGPNLRIVALPLSVLLVVNFLNLATGPGFLIFAGTGYLRPGMQSALLGIILNIVLSLVLIYRLGFAGAVIGTSLSLLVASAFFMYLFHHRTGYGVGRLLRESYVKPLTCSILLLGVWFAIRPEKASSWTGLFGGGLAFGVIYIMILIFGHFFDGFDWDKAESFVPLVRYARRSIPVA
jgi:O-antigen/teichoic acid export membrane protein